MLAGILVRKVSPTHVLAGHARAGGGGGRGAYHVSHVSLYRAPALSVYTALHLTAHGPDASCQVTRLAYYNHPSSLTYKMLFVLRYTGYIFQLGVYGQIRNSKNICAYMCVHL